MKRGQNHQHIPKTLENAGEFRMFIYELTESKIFSVSILFVILLNTVILVIQTDEAFSVKAGWYLSALDNVFLAIYFMEIVLKLYALRSYFFKTGWNIMDLLIVLFTMVDFLLPLIVQNVGSFDVAAIFRLLRMFRAIRALRALRVLRTIRFLKNLQVIMTTILKSFRALSTIVMLQGLFLYMFAVIGRGLFYEVAPTRFGTLGKAFFTLFQLITLDDWFYMYSDVVAKSPGHGYIILYLIVYIVLENFIFMNLFVAVLVDNFQRTITAVEVKPHKKQSGLQFKSVFEEVQLSDHAASAYSFSDDYDDFEEDEDEEQEIRIVKRVEDYYPEDKFSARERALINDYFTLLASLEYNMQEIQKVQKLVNDLVDITVTIPDVPEELI
ncbi:cation channel sperm-associated protein 1-like [Porites lutea]|uniref:cation channel sperm-associated protein 1-like n=1 Tax=Porites lutea TaxID=51062 RepID=UPI003CC515DB